MGETLSLTAMVFNGWQHGNRRHNFKSIIMKTHLVIDLVYHEDNEVFAGTYEECLEWKRDQGFGYKIVPMTKEERAIHNQLEQ